MLQIIQWFTIIYVIVLTLLLELPSSVRSTIPPEADGYEHFMTFVLLGFLVELSREKRSLRFWVSILVLYSVATEVLQGLLNPICHRFFTWDDLCQNILGVFLGVAVGYYFRPVIR